MVKSKFRKDYSLSWWALICLILIAVSLDYQLLGGHSTLTTIRLLFNLFMNPYIVNNLLGLLLVTSMATILTPQSFSWVSVIVT